MKKQATHMEECNLNFWIYYGYIDWKSQKSVIFTIFNRS